MSGNNSETPPKAQNNENDIELARRATHASRDQVVLFSKWRIVKNLIVLSFGLILLFTAYNGLSMLQSTMNQTQGIGVASQAIIYAGFFVSALLFPKYTIKKLGCKRALIIAMSCYIPYVAANFYFTWITMVPSAILVGLGAGVLWSSNCTYFTESAERYSYLISKSVRGNSEPFKLTNSKGKNCIRTEGKIEDYFANEQEKTLSINGDDKGKNINIIFNSKDNAKVEAAHSLKEHCTSVDEKYNCVLKDTNLELSSNLSENKEGDHAKPTKFPIKKNFEEHSKIVSSVTARFFGFAGLAIRSSDIWSNLISYYILQDNSVLDNVTENGNCSCGASFCNVKSNCFDHNLAEPNHEMRNILTGISVIVSVLGVILVLLFLDELKTDKQPVKFSFNLALATCKFIRKKEALLLFPLSAYIGFQQGFYIGDFTKSYIACAWGVYHVGFVTIAYGTAAGISSTVAGILVKYIGRLPVMLGGGVINAGVTIYLLIWNPLPDQPIKFFLTAAFFGLAVGTIWSQLRGFYGVIFKDEMEAAFAGFYLWDSVGYCTAFSYSNYICTYIKIYILLAVSTLGFIGYVKTESLYSQRLKESNH